MREALKLALEALEKYACDFGSSDLSVKAMYVVREALAQPDQLFQENERLHVENRRLIERIETIGVPVGVGGFVTTTTQPKQEPVAWMEGESVYWHTNPSLNDWIRANGTPLYTTPPQRTWVGLTDEEREELMDTYDVASTDYVQAIEAKLKEKNA